MQPFVTWLASWPKTGSTWVRAMLNAYYYAEHFHPNRMDLCPGEPSRHVYNSLWPYDEPFDFQDWCGMRYTALINEYGLMHHPDFHCIKTHTANVVYRGAQLIPETLTVGAIYVARDPRDTLISAAKYFRNDYRKMWEKMQSDDFSLGGQSAPLVWQPCSSYRMHLTSWLDNPTAFPVMRVLYEDMIEDPARELRRIVEFLRLDLDEDLLHLAVKLASFSELRKAEDLHGFSENGPAKADNEAEKGPPEKFFRVGKAGQWKTELPADLADEVYEALKPLENLWGNPRKPVGQAD